LNAILENDDVIEAPVIPTKSKWDDEDAEDDDIKVSFIKPAVYLLSEWRSITLGYSNLNGLL